MHILTEIKAFVFACINVPGMADIFWLRRLFHSEKKKQNLDKNKIFY